MNAAVRHQAPARARVAALGGARGFTLVELMVALSGGLFLSVMVFALARDSSRFFQREGRVASATLAGMVGFERLKSDIGRAGYLSTPNIQRDPAVLSRGPGGTPAGMETLAGIRITPDTPNLSGNGAFSLNKNAGQELTPDQVLLTGSYNATDEYAISSCSAQTICLQNNQPGMARLGFLTASNSANQLALLQNVFGAQPGQILRVRNMDEGHLYFAEIASVAATGPCITLATPLPVRTGGSISGLSGNCMGWSANVVNRVRYRVMDLQSDAQGAAWRPMFEASQGAEGEETRTELVRDQLDASGAVIDGTTDVVAEYAVDLDFAVLGQLAAGATALTQASTTSGTFTQFFAANGVGDRPEGVRSVRVRLSVRSREADRTAGIPGGFYRFKVSSTAWARVRTFQADVALMNQMYLTW